MYQVAIWPFSWPDDFVDTLLALLAVFWLFGSVWSSNLLDCFETRSSNTDGTKKNVKHRSRDLDHAPSRETDDPYIKSVMSAWVATRVCVSGWPPHVTDVWLRAGTGQRWYWKLHCVCVIYILTAVIRACLMCSWSVDQNSVSRSRILVYVLKPPYFSVQSWKYDVKSGRICSRCRCPLWILTVPSYFVPSFVRYMSTCLAARAHVMPGLLGLCIISDVRRPNPSWPPRYLETFRSTTNICESNIRADLEPFLYILSFFFLKKLQRITDKPVQISLVVAKQSQFKLAHHLIGSSLNKVAELVMLTWWRHRSTNDDVDDDDDWTAYS